MIETIARCFAYREAETAARDARIAELEARIAERDDALGIIATTADRLNEALRESGCVEMIGDVYRSLALRDGVVALYDRGAWWRARIAELEAENKWLREDVRRRHREAWEMFRATFPDEAHDTPFGRRPLDA